MKNGRMKVTGTAPRKPIRFRWSHDHWLHRHLVRTLNGMMGVVPFNAKYTLQSFLRRSRTPYSLVSEGDTVVQIGAPMDTILAGRSRAVHFALRVGPTGHVFVFEPDKASAEYLERLAQKQKLEQIHVICSAVWSEEKIITVYINDSHPASSFSEGTKRYDNKRLAEYRRVDIPANTLDAMLGKLEVDKVNLVSITTNGAEKEIMNGMRNLLAKRLKYIALAATGDGYVNLMRDFGYALHSADDRGWSFEIVN